MRSVWPSQRLALGLGVETEPGLADRLVDRLRHRAVPDLDDDEARLGDAHRRHLVERQARAVGVDMDRVEEARGGAAGAQAAELLPQHFQPALHAAAQVDDDRILCHGITPLR
jgi:hypothetical protein